jgi:hypothetical protein
MVEEMDQDATRAIARATARVKAQGVVRERQGRERAAMGNQANENAGPHGRVMRMPSATYNAAR